MHIVIPFRIIDIKESYGTLKYLHWKFWTGYFSKTISWISIKLCRINNKYHSQLCISLLYSGLMNFRGVMGLRNICVKKKITASSQKSMVGFQGKLISTMHCCAYLYNFRFDDFNLRCLTLKYLPWTNISKTLSWTWIKLCRIDKYHA